MSERQQIPPSNDSSQNSVSKHSRLPRPSSKLDSLSDNDTVYVDAIDAYTNEPAKIMYTNAQVIGSGSFGMVFAAFLNGDREVAIKKVLQDKRYKNRELQILRELRHPNIVSLLYFFYSVASSETVENPLQRHSNDESERSPPSLPKPKDSYLNLVQEYMPQTLSRIIKHYWHLRQPIPMAHVVLYSFQMIRGLAYVHGKNICHRDIKPQNLLVNPETGVLKICDFGSTKVLVPGEPNVSYICSRYYRAPELIFGATQYTVLIDMWSAGCVIGELLLGRPLFPGDSGVDQLVEIIKVLGTPSLEQVKEMNPQYSKFVFPTIKSCPWEKLISNRSGCGDAFDLLRALLVYSPSLRQTARDALAASLFLPVISDSTLEVLGNHSSSTSRSFPSLRPIEPFNDDELDYLPAVVVETLRRQATAPNNSHEVLPALGHRTSTDGSSTRISRHGSSTTADGMRNSGPS